MELQLVHFATISYISYNKWSLFWQYLLSKSASVGAGIFNQLKTFCHSFCSALKTEKMHSHVCHTRYGFSRRHFLCPEMRSVTLWVTLFSSCDAASSSSFRNFLNWHTQHFTLRNAISLLVFVTLFCNAFLWWCFLDDYPEHSTLKLFPADTA